MTKSSLLPKLVLATAFVGLATAAYAQSRPYSPRMSCQAAASMVASRGAVVMSTGPSTYDRFVRSQPYCTPTEVTRPAWVRTADNPQCFIGYTCEEAEYDRPFPF